LGSDNPASGTSGSVTSATSNSAVSSTSAESDSSAADDASSTSVTSDNNALMVALSASDSSPSPPPAKRNRLADGQPDKAAPANYSWAADALAAITQAGPAGQAPAAKHASPIRQRGWFAAQHVSLLAAPALQASAHDVSARPNSSLKNRSRSSGTAQASSARQSRSPAAHTRSPVGQGRSSARLQSPGTYSRRSQRLSRPSKRRSKSRKGFPDRQRKSPARRHRSPERQRRSPSRSPVGVWWQHKVWQERVRAQLQSPDMAAGEQRWGPCITPCRHKDMPEQVAPFISLLQWDSPVLVLMLVLSVYRLSGHNSCILVLSRGSLQSLNSASSCTSDYMRGN